MFTNLAEKRVRFGRHVREIVRHRKHFDARLFRVVDHQLDQPFHRDPVPSIGKVVGIGLEIDDTNIWRRRPVARHAVIRRLHGHCNLWGCLANPRGAQLRHETFHVVRSLMGRDIGRINTHERTIAERKTHTHQNL